MADQPMKIDVDAVLAERLPKVRRWLPRWLVRRLERMICQDQMNALLADAAGMTGSQFCASVMRHLDVAITVEGESRLPSVDDRRVLFICNHPLGGLDGIALIDFVACRYGVEPLFIVNDLLLAIEPLRDVFVPIKKYGNQSKDAALNIDAAFESDRPLIIFPAGLVSRRGKKGVIADLQWQKMFVNKAVKSRRTIVPLFFDGKNSPFFYKFAKFRTRLGLKFNIEMVRLPKEVFRAAGSRFTVYVGDPIPPEAILAPGESPRQAADRLRNVVYSLAEKPATTAR